MARRRRWLSPKEVACYWRVSPDTIYRAIRRGELAARRFPSGRIVVAEEVAQEFAAISTAANDGI